MKPLGFVHFPEAFQETREQSVHNGVHETLWERFVNALCTLRHHESKHPETRKQSVHETREYRVHVVAFAPVQYEANVYAETPENAIRSAFLLGIRGQLKSVHESVHLNTCKRETLCSPPACVSVYVNTFVNKVDAFTKVNFHPAFGVRERLLNWIQCKKET